MKLAAKKRLSFTLIELLVVMGVILILMVLLLPAMSGISAHAADAGAHQLVDDLANARMTAIASRAHMRVLLPTASSNFASASAAPADVISRGYVTVQLNRTTGTWTQRGKWMRFANGVAIQSVTPIATPSPMTIDPSGTGASTYVYQGPYVEFLANGSAALNPSPTPSLVVADGLVDSSGTFVPKNKSLSYTINIDSLSGSTSIH